MKLRKLLAAVVSGALSLPVLAQEGGSSDWDFSFVGDAAEDMAQQFKTVMTGDVASAVYVILGILVGFYLLLKLPRLTGLGKK